MLAVGRTIGCPLALAVVDLPIRQQPGLGTAKRLVHVCTDLRRCTGSVPYSHFVDGAGEKLGISRIPPDRHVPIRKVVVDVREEAFLTVHVKRHTPIGFEHGGQMLPTPLFDGESGGTGLLSREHVPLVVFAQDRPVISAIIGADDVLPPVP